MTVRLLLAAPNRSPERVRALLVSAVALAVLSSIACGGDAPTQPPPTDPIVLSATVPTSPSNVAAPHVTGRAAPLASITFHGSARCDDGPLGAVDADAAGAFDATVHVPTNRATTIRARYVLRRNAGCDSTAGLDYVHDGIPPDPPRLLRTQPASPAGEIFPTVFGQGEDGTTVKLYSTNDCSGTPLGTVAPTMGAFQVDVRVRRNATTVIRATATDAAGNVSGCTLNGLAYVNDSVAPPEPTFTGTTPVSPGQSLTPTLDGQSEPDAVLRVYVGENCQGSTAGGGLVTPSGRFAIQVTVAPNARSVYSAKAIDDLGNISPCTSTPIAYVHDDTAPRSPIFTGSDPTSPSRSQGGTLLGTAEPGTEVRIFTTPDCSGAPVRKTTADGSGHFSAPISVPPNGSTTFYAASVDAAGNVSECSPGITFTNDTVAPSAPTPTDTAPTSPGNTLMPALIGTAEPGATVRVYGSADCSGAPLGDGPTDAQGAFRAVVTVGANQSTRMWATATDAAGNLSGCSTTSVTYLHDGVAPAAPTLTRNAPLGPSPVRDVTFEGTAEPLSTARIYATSDCSGTAEGAGPTDASGHFSVVARVPANQPSVHRATATDRAGNVSPCSATTLSYVHDDTPPAAPALASTDPASPTRTATRFTLSGTAEAGTTVTLYTQALCAGSPLGSQTADAGGAFHFDVTVQPNTRTALTATATDRAGNVSACGGPLVFVHDSLPPPAPTWAGTRPTSPSRSLSADLLGATEADSRVSIFAGPGCVEPAVTTATSDATGAFVAHVTVLPDSRNRYSARAVDPAGNVSDCSPDTVAYRNDSRDPDPPSIVSVSPPSPGNDPHPVAHGVTEPDATVAIYDTSDCSGTPLGTGVADTDTGAYAVTLDIPRNATSNLHARATDIVGGRSGCTAENFFYTHDDIAPDVPVLFGTTPASPSAVSTAPILWGMAEPDTRIRVWLTAGCLGTPAAETRSSLDGSFNLVVQVTPNSTATLGARAIDEAGNASACSDPVLYVHDDTPPAKPTWLASTPPSPAPTTTPILSGTTEPGATVGIYGGGGCGGAPFANVIADSTGAFSQSVTVAPESTTTFSARAADVVGNVSTCSAPFAYRADATPPDAPIVTGTSPATTGNNPRPLVQGRAEPASRVRVYAAAGCTGASVGDAVTAGDGSFSVPAAATPNATTTFFASAMDEAGNVSACSTTSATYVHDDRAPDAPTLTGTQPPSPQRFVNTPTILGSAEANSSVRLYRGAGCSGTATSTVTAGQGGEVQISITLPAESMTDLSATATDAAGNVSACSAPITYIVDSVPPVFAGPTRAVPLSDSSIRVEWNAATDGTTPQGQIKYDVCWSNLRALDGGCAPFAANATSTPGATAYVITGLSATLRYFIQVRAIDLTGNRDANGVEVTTKTFGTGAVSTLQGRFDHACAILSTGELRCWGRNDSGQLGDGTTTTPRPTAVAVAGINNARAVAPSRDHTCALLADGTVRCWGSNADGRLGIGDLSITASTTPLAVPGLANVVGLASGYRHTCALSADGTARCWGDNTEGLLGDGSRAANSATPSQVSGLAGAISIATGGKHSCALLGDRTARCWGANDFGQLGNENILPSNTPVQVGGVGNFYGISKLSAGESHTCILRADGSPWCWGANYLGQLGIGGTTAQVDPFFVATFWSDYTEVVAGGYHTCALRMDGSGYCWGDDSQGQLGINSWDQLFIPGDSVAGLNMGQRLALGLTHSCARRANGTVRCWGENTTGQLDNGQTLNALAPVVSIGLDGISSVTAIASGRDHACALRADGSVACWGRNDNGQLGDGTAVQRSTPTPPLVTTIVEELAGGDSHTCMRSIGGEVRCWGRNQSGQLGDGTTLARATPAGPIALGGGVRALASNGDHVCALTVSGGVSCWGRGTEGQLGDGAGLNRATPVVVGLGAVQPTLPTAAVGVSAGRRHSCALLASGQVACWGEDSAGQLGDGQATRRLTPVLVSDGAGGRLGGVISVVAGDEHTCALLSSGGVKCWGRGDSGQLGRGSASGSLVPVAVSGLGNATAVTAGATHACARRADGAIFCWGNGGNGRLGNAATANQLTPVQVQGLGDGIGLAAGGTHTIVLRADGTAAAFGGDIYGQLGDGTMADRATPLPVIYLP